MNVLDNICGCHHLMNIRHRWEGLARYLGRMLSSTTGGVELMEEGNILGHLLPSLGYPDH